MRFFPYKHEKKDEICKQAIEAVNQGLNCNYTDVEKATQELKNLLVEKNEWP